MINKVKKQISQITAQYNMKQQEEAKLENEHRIIKEKQAQIEDLKQKLQDTKDNLRRKQEEQKQLQKFNDFLESIV
jgi:chromosome segregation ATPase